MEKGQANFNFLWRDVDSTSRLRFSKHEHKENSLAALPRHGFASHYRHAVLISIVPSLSALLYPKRDSFVSGNHGSVLVHRQHRLTSSESMLDDAMASSSLDPAGVITRSWDVKLMGEKSTACCCDRPTYRYSYLKIQVYFKKNLL